jgi:hypothetical protein
VPSPARFARERRPPARRVYLPPSPLLPPLGCLDLAFSFTGRTCGRFAAIFVSVILKIYYFLHPEMSAF